MRHMTLAAAFGLAVMAGPALAIDEVELSVLAGPCASCHGPDGNSPSTIPSIAGHDREELKSRMLAFRAGEVASATVMPRHMRGYTEEQIDALARYFSEIE
ncbi:MAG: cytochrome C [Paracoccus sp. (in: a-proteobacteria)]|nr:cytochrome C [Paracoccus sp. (in: a-proteobacteria)]